MIEWYAFNDGWGIVGWCFICPECNEENRFADYWEDEIICEYCNERFDNPGDPEG